MSLCPPSHTCGCLYNISVTSINPDGTLGTKNSITCGELYKNYRNNDIQSRITLRFFFPVRVSLGKDMIHIHVQGK